MKRRSELRHTAVDNGLGLLFEPQHQDGATRVLRGTAEPNAYREVRKALDRWRAASRPAVLENLQAFEREYSPYAAGLNVLHRTMTGEHWERVAAAHGARVRDRLGVAAYVGSVREAIRRFDEGIEAVADGTMSLEMLRSLHAEMVDAYHAP